MAKHRGRAPLLVGSVIGFVVVGVATGFFGKIGENVSDLVWGPAQPQAVASAPSPAPSTPQSALRVARTDWPYLADCDGATRTALLSGKPSSIGLDDPEDIRTRMTGAGGAVWEDGTLQFTLDLVGPTPAHVTRIEPVIFDRSKDAPAWVYDPQGGCGGDYLINFALDLDQTRPRLTQSPLADVEDDPTGTRLSGDSFTVTPDEGVKVRVDVGTCSGITRWGLVVTYSLNDGQDHVLRIGAPETPLISGGGEAPSFTRAVGGGLESVKYFPRFGCRPAGGQDSGTD